LFKIEVREIRRDLIENHEQQVAAMASVKDEIECKISQRKIALERWFPKEAFDISRSAAYFIGKHIEETQFRETKISELKERISRLKRRVSDRRCILSVCKSGNLPSRSSIVKNLNFQLDGITDQFTKISAELSSRRILLLKQLAYELYPIEFHGKFRSIRGLALPSISGLKRCESKDDESVTTALGYLAHSADLASRVLDAPLKLVIVPAGSCSVIKDRFSVPTLEEFPLYLRGGDKQKYLIAIQMLQDTLFHFARFRGKKVELTSDLLELADSLLVREINPNS
jgi:hypothetical protein